MKFMLFWSGMQTYDIMNIPRLTLSFHTTVSVSMPFKLFDSAHQMTIAFFGMAHDKLRNMRKERQYAHSKITHIFNCKIFDIARFIRKQNAVAHVSYFTFFIRFFSKIDSILANESSNSTVFVAK